MLINDSGLVVKYRTTTIAQTTPLGEKEPRAREQGVIISTLDVQYTYAHKDIHSNVLLAKAK